MEKDKEGIGSTGSSSPLVAGPKQSESSSGTSGQSQLQASEEASTDGAPALLPAISLPTGGGAIRGIGEKFEVNAVTGTAGLSIPLPVSPGRGGQGPQIGLSYSSGAGNGPIGLGFSLSVPMITRKTDKGLPRYLDTPGHETDTFLLSGAEDLVPFVLDDGSHKRLDRSTHWGYLYRPRIEGLFARIERMVPKTAGETYWQVTTPDNVTHIYGKTDDARVRDPRDTSKVFTWYLQETRDDKGNVTVYEYKRENGAGVDANRLGERSRFEYGGTQPVFLATAQLYLKRVFYGNRTQFQVDNFQPTDFLFELVFDYGEHTAFSTSTVPAPNDVGAWSVRQDPFSSYRSGFEVRTYRLCQRALMFHRIDTVEPLLVRATEFGYEAGPAFTYLSSVVQAGFLQTGGVWERAVMPTLKLSFQKPELHDELVAIDPASLEGLRGGTDGSRKQWVDLDGEGIPGVLIDQGGGWFYKENRGEGELKPPRRLHTQPNPSALAGGAQSLEDIDGDGRLELVSHTRSLSGYFARTVDGDFEPLRGFQSVPNINWRDPNLRIIDLDGDGHGDILITEDQAFVWYRSKAKDGFEESKRVAISFDENEGPRVVFSDAEQSIQLADMSGDGLVDIVRIRNGEVCFWPNLGYGRFGKKVTLENSPLFATPQEFHASRVRFGDIDGSGTSDLFYFGSKGTALYFNQAGNRLGAAEKIHSLPPVDSVTQANVADLLGTGTSCLVWSSPVANPSQNIFYVDIMGSKKPHLLVEVDNNLGAVTKTTYASSTKFYLQDKKDGIKWLTRLPFPVQVVERVEKVDAISGGKFVSRYSYRHGFFDGYEREFRGFARVETLDAEDFAEDGQDPLLYQSPVKTISWFHTGAWLEKERLETALRKEYYPPEPPPNPLTVADNLPLEELVEQSPGVFLRQEIPAGSTSIQDAREAARALKGSPLRTEVYAEDADKNPTLAGIPYVVTETNQQVRRLQKSRGENKYGVFFAFNRESVTISSERNPSDPRVGHQIALDIDQFGNVKRSASLVYGRATGDTEQRQDYVTLNEVECTNQDEDDVYRLGTEYETRAYEITGLTLPNAGTGLVTVAALRTALDALNPANDLDFDEERTSGVQRRLLDRKQQTFYVDTFTLANASTFTPPTNLEAPLGDPGLRALPYQTYQLALTPGNVTLLVSTSATLTSGTNAFDPALLVSEGKYVDRESNGNYWTVSGRAVFNPEAGEFYLPVKAFDPFGGEATVTWDSHKLLPVQATDPVGNVVQSTNDYRVLAPRLVTDPNLNRSEVAFDALGMVVATAVMGKDDGSNEGDVITDPTTTLEYDLLAYQDRQEPAFVKTTAKETHGPTDSNTKFQISYAYSDGFGRVAQQKAQAEPGRAPRQNPDGTLDRDAGGNIVYDDNVNPRWVGTGRTIYNNKGNPVKQYEPFFSSVTAFDSETDLVEWGVTPVITYDSIDRVVRTDFPEKTYSKVVFDSWQQETWDQNDTVLDSGWYSDRGSPSPTGSEPSDPDERAAWLSAQHAGTPTVVHLDSLGRPYKSVAHNVTGTGSGRVTAFYTTRTELDIEGNTLSITDARGNTTIEQEFDVLQRRLLVTSPDAGQRLAIQDVGGKALRAYNSRGFTSRAEYDIAQRPTHSWVDDGTNEILVVRMSYGESLDTGPFNTNPNTPSPAQAHNLRGQVHLAFDTAGKVKTVKADFKGNILEASRALAEEYKDTPDWAVLATITAPATLESTADALLALAPGTSNVEVFTTETAYDALNRVTLATSPASQTSGVTFAPSMTRPEYNEASFLNALHVAVRGASESNVINNIDYNERGQRTACDHANPTTGATSHSIAYTYNPETFRLTRMLTTRTSDSVVLQDLRYFFDAVGNITEVQDHADTAPVFSGSAPVSGTGYYQYDALYRLTYAEGREHPGQQPTDADPTRSTVPHPNDLQALLRYDENYTYDQVGNIESVVHHVGGAGWTRLYEYETASNRLVKTYRPSDTPAAIPPLVYDAHGSMTQMPHLSTMAWDFADRLQHTERSGGGGQNTYFTYDAGGERVRKVYEQGSTVRERVYLGGLEIYRERSSGMSGTVELERETLHVMDDTRRVAMVETKTVDTSSGATGIGTARWRFQLGNHLDSASLELDESAGVLSYEEYHPYGSTAFHSALSGAEVSAKRYRYTGKEKDEETGLYYHGARYYAPWLGRWTAADPAGLVDGLNLYRYSRDNPARFADPGGTQSQSGSTIDYWTETALEIGPVAFSYSGWHGAIQSLQKATGRFDYFKPSNVPRKAADFSVDVPLESGDTTKLTVSAIVSKRLGAYVEGKEPRVAVSVIKDSGRWTEPDAQGKSEKVYGIGGSATVRKRLFHELIHFEIDQGLGYAKEFEKFSEQLEKGGAADELKKAIGSYVDELSENLRIFSDLELTKETRRALEQELFEQLREEAFVREEVDRVLLEKFGEQPEESMGEQLGVVAGASTVSFIRREVDENYVPSRVSVPGASSVQRGAKALGTAAALATARETDLEP